MAYRKVSNPSELSPAYRKRLESGLAKGYTASQAAGKPKTTELPVTLVKLAEVKGNTSYLLKEVNKRKNADLIRQYLNLQKQIKKKNQYPKGSAGYDREAKIEDTMARNLAHDLRSQDLGRDLYAIPTYNKPYIPTEEESEREVSIEQSEEQYENEDEDY
jgi:hypothetical protein